MKKFAQRFPLQFPWERGYSSKVSDHKKFSQATIHRKIREKPWHHLALKKNIYISRSFVRLEINFCKTIFNELHDGICARWCKSSSRHEKDEMTSGSKMQPNKNQFRNDFKISQSDREIPFKLTELNFISNWVWSSLSFHIFLHQTVTYIVHFGSVAEKQGHSYQLKSSHCPPQNCPVSMVYNPFRFRNE